MFDIEMTINGKPLTEANVQDEFEKAILSAVMEGVKEKITSSLTPAEAQQISVDFEGDSLDDLSARVSGPEEIVKKVEAALRD